MKHVCYLKDDLNHFFYNKYAQNFLKCDSEFVEIFKNNSFDAKYQKILESAGFLNYTFDFPKKQEFKITNLRVFLTDACNYACKYCFINKKSTDQILNKSFFEFLKKFLDESKNEKKIIQFFGGEPLLKFDSIKKIVTFCESNSDDKFEYYVSTNGSLLNEENTDYFAKKKFNIGISLDGNKKINDKNRILKNGVGTYDFSTKGIPLLKKKGIFFYILITPNNDNIAVLYDEVVNLIELFNPNSITLNKPNNNGFWKLNGKKLSDASKNILTYCISKNITFKFPGSQILHALKHKCLILNPCHPQNATISLTSDGRVCGCPINFKKENYPERYSELDVIRENSILKSQFELINKNPSCQKCIAYTTCGGACPIVGKDKDKCLFFKDFTTWCITNDALYNNK